MQGGYVCEGYLLCQKHVNEKGGVLGRPIVFLIRDDLNKLLTGQDQSNTGQLKQRIDHKIKCMSRDRFAWLRTDADEQPGLAQPHSIGALCHDV